MSKLVNVLIIPVLIAAIGVNFWLDLQRAQQNATEFSALESSLIVPDIVKDAQASVFLVDGANFLATAFLVDAKCGLFATNAHVAKLIADSKEETVLRQNEGRKTFKITGSRVHPANALFRHLVDVYGPLNLYATGKLQTLPIPTAYDVALLQTRGPDCTGEADLAGFSALTIAPEEALSALHGGDPIAVIGFPGTGTLTRGVEALTTLPRIEMGNIRAMGTYVPVASGSKLEHEVILHTLSTTPGTSGSPILDYKGRVVGVNQGAAGGASAENLIALERIGHRADAVAELVSGQADEVLTAKYTSRVNAMLEPHYSAAGAIAYAAENLAPDLFKKTLKLDVKYLSTKPIKGTFGEVKDEFSTPTEPGWNTSVKIAEKGRYYLGRVTLAPNRSFLLAALDYDITIQNALCPIKIGYRLAKGNPALGWTSSTAFPRLFITPNKEERTLEFVLWRDVRCSEDFLSFDLGLSSFDAAKPAPPVTSFFRNVAHGLSAAWTSARRLLDPNGEAPLVPPPSRARSAALPS